MTRIPSDDPADAVALRSVIPESGAQPPMNHLEEFTAHRSAVFGAAYRVLGGVADADDVVQEAWLRWSRVDLDEVRRPRAYLVATATRLALDRVREVQRRRESYIGPWLPEPLTDRHSDSTDPATQVELASSLADSLSMAMQVVLSTLTPLERAVFVLRDVFDLPYAEVAATIGRTEPATRQLAHRARSHVQARAPRVPVDQRIQEEVLQRFFTALQGGSMTDLLQVLAPDAVLITDGGGQKQAALRPIHGADKIVRWLAGIMAKSSGDVTAEVIRLHDEPAMVLTLDGELDTLGMIRVEDGRIGELYLIRNPDKLVTLAAVLDR